MDKRMDVLHRSNWQREKESNLPPRRSCCKNSSLCFPSFSDDNGAIRSKITFEQFNLAIKFKSHFSRHIPPSLPPSTAMPGGFSAPHCQQRDGGRQRGRHSLYKRFEKAKQSCKFLQHEPRLLLPGWARVGSLLSPFQRVLCSLLGHYAPKEDSLDIFTNIHRSADSLKNLSLRRRGARSRAERC